MQSSVTAFDHLMRGVVVVGAAMTFVGFLAQLIPTADIVNHFRPLTLAGCIGGIALALLARRKQAGIGLAVLAVINTFIVLIASSYATPAVETTAGRDLKIETFNVYGANENLAEASKWLIAQNADIMVLEEMTSRSKPSPMPTLEAAFPHIYDCGCNDIIVASKRPWLKAGGHTRTATLPSWSWIELDDEKGGKLRVVGMRPYYPYRSNEQAVHYSWIENQLASIKQPMIVVGDFNLTPWSWKLQRLSHRTGLARHGTWARSWPAQDNWPNIPAFLIDNVLTSPEIKAVSFKTGPGLGSDHLPIIATIRLP